MKKINTHKLSQKGDTIVEVLISIAVMSAVLGGAFVSANHSLQNSRQSQERGEALKMAQSQFERLKVTITDTKQRPKVLNTANDYCIDSSNHVVDLPAGYDPAAGNPTLVNDDFSNYSGTPACVQGFYHASVKYDKANNDTFVVTIRWDRVGGNGKDEIQMLYKVHP